MRYTIDTECTGLNPWTGDRPFACSVLREDGWKRYFNWRVDPFTRQVIYKKEDIAFLNSIIGNEKHEKIYHNAKFDIRMLDMVGVPFKGKVQDTLLAVKCARSDMFSFKLKPLCAKFCDIPMDDEQDLQKCVQAARRIAKKLDWKIADELAADYWIPREVALRHPELIHGGDKLEIERWLNVCQVYCEKDTERAFALWTLMNEHVLDEEEVRDSYDKEMELFWVVYDMEKRGFNLLPDELIKYTKIQEEALKKLTADLKRWNPKGYNLNSPKQLQQLLWEDLKIPVPENIRYGKKLKRGSTSMKVLEKIDHPIVMTLLHHRGTEKLLSTFLYKYDKLAVPDEDGNRIIHPDFSQFGAATGRFSCHNPNIQNVPEPTKTRSIIRISSREVFGPRPGHVWFHFDYSGLEVRIFADDAREETMLETIRRGEDPHGACANKAWGGAGNPAGIRLLERLIRSIKPEQRQEILKLVGKKSWPNYQPKSAAHYDVEEALALQKQAIEEIINLWLAKYNWDIVKAEAAIGTKNARAIAKMLLFLKLYGGGVDAAASLMNVDDDEARRFLADYDKANPGIPRYMNMMMKLARKQGYIRTMYNLKIPVDMEFCYKAVNYRVQGTAAGLLKDKMIACEKLCKELRARGIMWWIIGSIHDEIVFECRQEHSYPWVLRRIKQTMEDCRDVFKYCPLEVECSKTTTTWREPEKVDLHVHSKPEGVRDRLGSQAVAVGTRRSVAGARSHVVRIAGKRIRVGS